MSSKQSDQASKLTGGGALPGWEAQLKTSRPQPEPEPEEEKKPTWNYKGPDAPDKVVRKTYLVTNELKDRIETLARENNVGSNELVRFLLTAAVDRVESGEIELPVVPRNTLAF